MSAKDGGKGGEKGHGKGKDGKDEKGGKGPHANHFYIDGKIYDFSEWKLIHPGGDVFFRTSFERDISAAYHAYHRRPETLAPVLDKYEVKVDCDPLEVIEPKMNVPPFILPAGGEGFDARTDRPVYDWNKGFMHSLRKKISTPDMVRRLRRANKVFDATAVCLFCVHAFVSFPALYLELLPWWFYIVLQVLLRTALAGVGHYHCHRAKNGIADWADPFFDMQYVGASVILADGHVMLHHLYTETPADVKRTVFCFVLTLPRLWRVPIFTMMKFGEFFTGHLRRMEDLELKLNTRSEARKELQLKAVRYFMLCELFWACLCGKLHLWFLQFFLTVWVNMFQIVASHDFEVVREKQEYRDLDWGIFQVQHALDTYITGIQCVDIFLSAGLSCHRVHHVLPYQGSGFADILALPAVRETCKEFGVEWCPPRNLILDRFLPLAWYNLTAPAQIQTGKSPILLGGGGVAGFFQEHRLSTLLENLSSVRDGFLGYSI
jgi:hypothetical protein